MKKIIQNIRLYLILLLFMTTSVTMALPPETEYLGIIARTGYYDDGAWGAFPIGFDFQFFGNSYNTFYVTSNGLVMFGGGSTQYSNNTIPTSSGANNFIAPFWDDIVIHATGEIMYQTVGTAPNRKLIAQFNNMSFYGSPILLGTFMVIIYEGSNEIQCQYRSIVDLTSARASGNSATIGLENINGTTGVLYSYNTAGVVESEKAIRFTPEGVSYNINDNAVYEGVLLVDNVARAGIPNQLTPGNNSTISENVSFNWETSANAASYHVVISQNTDLSSPIHTSVDLTNLTYDYTLATDQVYYWSVNAKNSSGVITWSEIWKFQTSSTPPLVGVPQTIYLEQGEQRTATLLYTGGDAGVKTATVTSLPAQGALYQYDNGTVGAQIVTVPTVLTDASFRVIYAASGAAGNGVGNFGFQFADGSGVSAAAMYNVNVSPPGIPNYLSAAKEIDRVEMTFDRAMADPTGKQAEFSVKDNGVEVSSVSCSLKPGDAATIVVYVTPNIDISNSITVAYSKGTVLAASGGILESFDFQLAGKQAQTITFATLPDKIYGDPDFTLSATASSGLPVTYSSANSTVVSLAGAVATINNAGETFITVTQAGDATYRAVSFQQRQIVNKADATIVLSDLSQSHTGTGIAVTVTTNPIGLNTTILYEGSTTLPVIPGTYNVVAQIDEVNYQGTQTGILTIIDDTAPVADVTDLPLVNEECSATLTAPTATDNYDGAITGVTATVFPITSSTTVLWTYTDATGNESSQTQEVVIADVTAPAADVPNLPLVNEECSVTLTAPTATDNCDGAITGVTSTVFPLTLSTTVLWTYTDATGNESSQTQEVVIADVTAPVADLTDLPLVNEECSATLTAPTAMDNCDGTITGVTSTVFPLTASTTVLWTYTDATGNESSQTQEVVIADVTAPVADLTDLPLVNEECSVTLTAPTAMDNCDGTITGVTSTVFPLTASTTVLWTYTDATGNESSQTQEVVIADVTAPVADLTDLPLVNEECSATLTAPTATDNCDGAITGVTSTVFPLTASTTVLWTYTDATGNISSQTQEVVIADVTAPVADVMNLPLVNEECSVTLTAPTAMDNCDGAITGVTSTIFPLTASTTVLWTYTDATGNESSQTQEVVIADVTAPVADVMNLPLVNEECSATLTAPTATDNCDGAITGVTSTVFPLTSSTTVLWTYTDATGNISSQTQEVVIADVTAPVADVMNLPLVNEECSATLTAPTATDNCDGAITGVTSTVFPLTSSTTVLWTYTDATGNISSQTQEVVIADVTAPVVDVPDLPLVNEECSATLTAPTATDNCDGAITGVTSTVFPLTSSTTVLWTYTDATGNISSQTQEVVIADVTAPVADVPDLPLVNEECSATLTAPTATDNCDGAITGVTSTVFPLTASTTVLWTYTDATGNISSQTQEVVIADVTAPVADVPDLPLVNEECSATLTAPTATDNCDGAITGFTSTVFPLTASTTVLWIYTDATGNSSSQTQEVVIADVTAPIPQIAELPVIVEECSATLDSPLATDNCDGEITATTSTQFPVMETTTVIWTYTDATGNSVNQLQGIVIADVTAPVVDVMELPVIIEECSATLEAPTATDNCDGPVVGTTETVFPVMESMTISWTFSDASGNSVVQYQEVLISDITAPQPDVSALPEVFEACSATLEAPTATDNCDGSVVGVTETQFPVTESVVVIWSYSDASGNVTTQSQQVIIKDEIAPVPELDVLPDVTAQCEAKVLSPKAMDNCDGIIMGITDTHFPVNVSTTVVWTYTDASGNVSTQIQEIIIEDNISPSIVCPDDLLVQVAEDTPGYLVMGDELDLVSYEDNCEIVLVSNSFNSSNTLAGEVFPMGSTTVTWLVQDFYGNVTTCDFDVVVQTSVGIGNNQEQQKFIVYPNPASESIRMEYFGSEKGIVNVTLSDISGHVVYHKTFEKSVSHFIQKMDVNHLPTGVYYLLIQSHHHILQKKLVITTK